MALILLEPGNPELVFGKTPDGGNGGNGGIDAIWRDAAALQGMGPCIELVSLHQGMKQQITTDVSNSARTSGRPVITEFTCVKYVDRISVNLYDLCLRAKPLGTGTDQPTKLYIARNSGDSKTINIMTMALRDAIISEIQFQSHPNDMPTEQFKLSFTEILWTFTVQEHDMSVAGNVQAGWSVMHNRPIGNAFT